MHAAFRASPRWLQTALISSARATHARIGRASITAATAARGNNAYDAHEVPTIPTCPAPKCDCAEMPPGLDIDYAAKDLGGTIAPYAEHVIVTTGQADWKSKIENEHNGDNAPPWGLLIARLKKLLGPKGQFFDAYRNTLVSASSFAAPGDSATNQPQVMLFPSFRMVDNVSASEAETVDLVRSFLLSQKAETDGEATSPSTNWNGRVRSIDTPTVLICSHNSRDSRCGVLGPLLHAEFEQYINKHRTLPFQLTSEMSSSSSQNDLLQSFASHPKFRPELMDIDQRKGHPINIGMISHIGGHKWAGNVIVYIPPGYQMKPLQRLRHGPKSGDGQKGFEPLPAEDEVISQAAEDQSLSPLAGKGIWYGRVEPRHVEGIVEMTIGHGQIIRELFRGGVHQDGTPIRL